MLVMNTPKISTSSGRYTAQRRSEPPNGRRRPSATGKRRASQTAIRAKETSVRMLRDIGALAILPIARCRLPVSE
jgi:hypothetical protein